MKKSLSLLISLLLAGAGAAVPFPAAAEASGPARSIEALQRRFDDRSCRSCHPEIYRQWQESWHSRSLVAAAGVLTEFLEVGLEKQWREPFSKAHLLKCLHCHAPTVQLASEELAREIADLVITVQEEKGSAEGEEAKRKLSGLNVGCTVCHNLRATTYLTGLQGRPEPGAVYGPTGADSPGHRTIQAEQLRRSLFCVQCHGLWTAPDDELMTCATIPGSYRNAYQSRGGARDCQDCHMRKAERGHLMPGGHVLEMIREGLGLRVEVAPYRHLPGQVPGVEDPNAPVPSAVVTAFVANRAGHRVPDG